MFTTGKLFIITSCTRVKNVYVENAGSLKFSNFHNHFLLIQSTFVIVLLILWYNFGSIIMKGITFITVTLFLCCYGVSLPLDYYREIEGHSIYFKYDINDIADNTLPIISTILKKIGFDPMPLPSFTEHFSINPLLVFNQKVTLHLSSGVLSRLSEVERHGNVSIYFQDESIFLRATVIHKNLIGRFNYVLDTFPVQQQGVFNTNVTDVKTTLYFVYDLKYFNFTLKTVNIEEIGSVKVVLDNNSLFDRFGSIMANKMIPSFMERIVTVSESMAYTVILKNIHGINEQLQLKLRIIKESLDLVPEFISLYVSAVIRSTFKSMISDELNNASENALSQ